MLSNSYTNSLSLSLSQSPREKSQHGNSYASNLIPRSDQASINGSRDKLNDYSHLKNHLVT
jgi:hypothetical protein